MAEKDLTKRYTLLHSYTDDLPHARKKWTDWLRVVSGRNDWSRGQEGTRPPQHLSFKSDFFFRTSWLFPLHFGVRWIDIYDGTSSIELSSSVVFYVIFLFLLFCCLIIRKLESFWQWKVQCIMNIFHDVWSDWNWLLIIFDNRTTTIRSWLG